jgi:hypothetical protein
MAVSEPMAALVGTAGLAAFVGIPSATMIAAIAWRRRHFAVSRAALKRWATEDQDGLQIQRNPSPDGRFLVLRMAFSMERVGWATALALISRTDDAILLKFPALLGSGGAHLGG